MVFHSSAIAEETNTEYISLNDCIEQGTHLNDCDDDGYCNLCGCMDEETVPVANRMFVGTCAWSDYQDNAFRFNGEEMPNRYPDEEIQGRIRRLENGQAMTSQEPFNGNFSVMRIF